MQYVWIGFLLAAVAVEALTTELVAIWFFPSAIVALVLSFFAVPPLVQVLVFLLLGAVLLFLFRPLCLRFVKPKETKTNIDAIIGKTALVTEEIDNAKECGEVRVGGLCWSARSAEGATLPVGAQVTVLAVDGVKLIVK